MTTISKLIENPTQRQVVMATAGLNNVLPSGSRFHENPHVGAKTELAHGQVLVKVYDEDVPYYEVRAERRFHPDWQHDPFQMQPWAVYETLGCEAFDDPDEDDLLEPLPLFHDCPTCGEDGGTSCGMPNCGLLRPPTDWPFGTA